jgi:hypothetical protein
MSYFTGTVTELLYASTTAGATLASFTTEAQLNTTATMGPQAQLPQNFWLSNQNQAGRGFRVEANGVLGSTGTPTFTFSLRGGASGNITTAPLLAGTAALTLATTLTAVPWKFEVDLVLQTLGAAGANSTLRGQGSLRVGGITASEWALWGGGASPGTVATLDASIVNFLNLNVACGASNAANTVSLNSLRVFGLN